jgi:hypothetical protein
MSDDVEPPKRRGFARWRRTPYGKGVLTGLGLWLGLWSLHWLVFESGSDFRVILVTTEFDKPGGTLYRLDGTTLEPNYAGEEITIHWPIRTSRQQVELREVIGHLPWEGPPPVSHVVEITATTKPCYVVLKRTPDGFEASTCLVYRTPM